MGRSPRLVNEIVRGRRSITAETALALALGLAAMFWLGLQSQYELSEAVTRRERRAAG